MSKTSLPSSSSDLRVMPSLKVSGSTPMPTRFERWMRSKLSAITALTPSSSVPLAAQSRDEPEPYSLPPITTSGTPRSWYFIAASKIDIASPSGISRVQPPSVPGATSLRRRMLAKVPRIITSWLPRREP